MPKTKDVFHSPLENLSDEELIVHLRSGEEAARATLVERYFRQNELRLRSAVLPPTPFLAEWQRKEVYFKTLCHASDTYRFGNKSTFSTYFTALLKREIAEENRKESHRVEAIALLGAGRHDGFKERDRRVEGRDLRLRGSFLFNVAAQVGEDELLIRGGRFVGAGSAQAAHERRALDFCGVNVRGSREVLDEPSLVHKHFALLLLIRILGNLLRATERKDRRKNQN